MSEKNKCPQCNSNDIIPITYGLIKPPGRIKRLLNSLRNTTEERVIFGGCCVDDDSPNKHCKKCKFQWK